MLEKISTEKKEKLYKINMTLLNWHIKYYGQLFILCLMLILYPTIEGVNSDCILISSASILVVLMLLTLFTDFILMFNIKWGFIPPIILSFGLLLFNFVFTVFFQSILIIKLFLYSVLGFFTISSLTSLIVAILFVKSVFDHMKKMNEITKEVTKK